MGRSTGINAMYEAQVKVRTSLFELRLIMTPEGVLHKQCVLGVNGLIEVILDQLFTILVSYFKKF